MDWTEAKRLYCKKCGFYNPEGARYCGNCGNRLKSDNRWWQNIIPIISSFFQGFKEAIIEDKKGCLFTIIFIIVAIIILLL